MYFGFELVYENMVFFLTVFKISRVAIFYICFTVYIIKFYLDYQIISDIYQFTKEPRCQNFEFKE